jgi:hypothetical protein
MPFSRAPVRAPARPNVRVAVFAVGRSAYIAGAGARSARVTLTDDAERPLASLSEGAEVTIVAWRPGWAGTTRYCVRVTDSGLEGWLPARDLRGTKVAIPSPPAPPPPPAARPTVLRAAKSETSGRRFGQRSS